MTSLSPRTVCSALWTSRALGLQVLCARKQRASNKRGRGESRTNCTRQLRVLDPSASTVHPPSHEQKQMFVPQLVALSSQAKFVVGLACFGFFSGRAGVESSDPTAGGPQRNTRATWTLAKGHAYDDAGVQRSALPICFPFRRVLGKAGGGRQVGESRTNCTRQLSVQDIFVPIPHPLMMETNVCF